MNLSTQYLSQGDQSCPPTRLPKHQTRERKGRSQNSKQTQTVQCSTVAVAVAVVVVHCMYHPCHMSHTTVHTSHRTALFFASSFVHSFFAAPRRHKKVHTYHSTYNTKLKLLHNTLTPIRARSPTLTPFDIIDISFPN